PATPVAQVQGRQHVADDAENRHGDADAESQEADDHEGERYRELDQPKLVWTQLKISARKVRRKWVGVLVRGYPDRGACRFETSPQLLANIGQGPVGDPRVPVDVGGGYNLVPTDDAVHDQRHPGGGGDSNDNDDEWHRSGRREV